MRSRSAVIAACWASSATSRHEDSGRQQLLGGARQRIERNLHPAADHRHEQADQGDMPGAMGLPGTDAADSGQTIGPWVVIRGRSQAALVLTQSRCPQTGHIRR